MKVNCVWPEFGNCRCIKRDKKLYFFAMNVNALCKIDLETGFVETIESISDECFDDSGLIINIVEYKNDLICIPYMAKQIHIIDLVSEKEIQKISANDTSMKESYYSAHIENSNLYLFPFIGNKMVQVDLEQKKIIKLVDMKKEYNVFTGNDYSFFSYSRCYVFTNKIYMAMYNVGMIVEYDLLLMRTHFYEIDGDSPFYVHLTGYMHSIYIMGNDGKIYIWNAKEHKLEKVLNLVLKEDENDRYQNSVKFGKYIYLFKYIPSDEFIRIDVETKQAEVISLNTMFKLEDSLYRTLKYMIADNEKFYFLSNQHVIYLINFDTKEFNRIPLKLNEKKMKDLILTHKDELSEKQEGPISEGACIRTLKNYITINDTLLNCRELKSDKKIGSIIFETISTK